VRHVDVDREAAWPVQIAIGMPANDRMDALVEKATELGVAAIQPLVCERSVLRLDGERAERKREHWHGVAVAASEQSGRTRLPLIHPVLALPAWLERLGPDPALLDLRWLLSPAAPQALLEVPAPHVLPEVPSPRALLQVPASQHRPTPPAAGHSAPRLLALSGPEGGLSAAEESMALARGFGAVSLGARVLRADTAPLALLAWWMLVQPPLSHPAATIGATMFDRS
jgi:16S rRNA (uracil1498-N3)-methyltransferase